MRGKRGAKGKEAGYSGEQTRVPSIQGVEGVEVSVPGSKSEGVTSSKDVMAKGDGQWKDVNYGQ